MLFPFDVQLKSGAWTEIFLSTLQTVQLFTIFCSIPVNHHHVSFVDVNNVDAKAALLQPWDKLKELRYIR